MRGFLGFIPSKESNTRGMTILPMFLLSKGPFLSWILFQDLQTTKLPSQYTENPPIRTDIWISTQITQNQPNVQLLEL